MRDLHLAGHGPKEYVGHLNFLEILDKIRKQHPTVQHGEGACGSWLWVTVDDGVEVVVAEAWMHKTKPGWWLRIIEKT